MREELKQREAEDVITSTELPNKKKGGAKNRGSDTLVGIRRFDVAIYMEKYREILNTLKY